MSDAAIRPAKISRVLPGSIAADLGFEPGDRLVRINGEAPRDLIDYNFLCADEVLELEVLDAGGKTHAVTLEKDFDAELGLEFETALFDGLIQCNNRCPFCFIDQQPPGKRDTLYLKDDDYRLSFLYGSYLTLTNLTQREWDRIERLRLSPLYVSVHATDPATRSRLLKNSRAGQILDQLEWFRQRRLQIHAQVVLCPGINDGPQLERTLRDLAQFYNADRRPAAQRAVAEPAGAPLAEGSGLDARGWSVPDSYAMPEAIATTETAEPVAEPVAESIAESPRATATLARPEAAAGRDRGDRGDRLEGFDSEALEPEALEPEALEPEALDSDALEPEFTDSEFTGSEFADSGFPESDREWEGAFEGDWPEGSAFAPETAIAETFDPILPPTVTSVAVVPVGLTRFRPDLDELAPVTPAIARETIARVRALQAEFRETLGSTFAWLADEWFLIAGQDLPPAESYEDYPQLDNGVGSIQRFVSQFDAAIAACPVRRVDPPRRYTWLVGNAVARAFAPLADRLSRIDGLTVTLAALRSDYWGQALTVTGLLTGQDAIAGLSGRDLGDGLLLPSLMLKQGDDRFLDDTTVGQVAEALGVPVWVTRGIDDLIEVCTAPPGTRPPDRPSRSP